MPTYAITFSKSAILHISASSKSAALSMLEDSEALMSMAESEVDSAPVTIESVTSVPTKGSIDQS